MSHEAFQNNFVFGLGVTSTSGDEAGEGAEMTLLPREPDEDVGHPDDFPDGYWDFGTSMLYCAGKIYVVYGAANKIIVLPINSELVRGNDDYALTHRRLLLSAQSASALVRRELGIYSDSIGNEDTRGAYSDSLVSMGFINLEPFLDGPVRLIFCEGYLHVSYKLFSEYPDFLPVMIDHDAGHDDDIVGHLVSDALRSACL